MLNQGGKRNRLRFVALVESMEAFLTDVKKVNALAEELWNLAWGLGEETWKQHTWDEGER